MKKRLPLTSSMERQILHFRSIIERIIDRRDPRLLIVMGPCSIHDASAAREYAARLQKLSEQVKTTCFLVMRVYVEKARSSTGWKGFFYDPDLDGTYDMIKGISCTRELLSSLTTMGVPLAAEFVDPLAAPFFADLISWGCIGARTSSSQVHRQFVSSLAMPVGFKNSTDGNLENAILGAKTARFPHSFLHVDEEGRLQIQKGEGNSFTHIVLRGSQEGTNYGPDSIQKATELLRQAGLLERLMIDCSHGNSQKVTENQKNVFFSILRQLEEGCDAILGIMLESYLEAGSQLLSPYFAPGLSITDPCIDWATTEALVLAAHERMHAAQAVGFSR